jgi:hypothetical protein
MEKISAIATRLGWDTEKCYADEAPAIWVLYSPDGHHQFSYNEDKTWTDIITANTISEEYIRSVLTKYTNMKNQIECDMDSIVDGVMSFCGVLNGVKVSVALSKKIGWLNISCRGHLLLQVNACSIHDAADVMDVWMSEGGHTANSINAKIDAIEAGR